MTTMEVMIVVFSSFFRNIFLKISIIGILCYYWLNIVALDSEEVRFLCCFALSLALTFREEVSFSTVSAYGIRVDTMLFFPSICPSTYPSVHPYMTTGKTIALTRQTFVGKVMSWLFNMLSRSVIAFLPGCKCLLISWLQSRSAVFTR